MIHAKLTDSARYEGMHPLFKAAFDYVKSHDLANAEPGRIVVDGDNLFINVDTGTFKSRADQLTEVHRRYIDIQIPLSGPEVMGWRPLSTITEEPVTPFDPATDRAFYHIPSYDYVEVLPGEFTIFFPEDAHAPAIGEGQFKKLIVKVRI